MGLCPPSRTRPDFAHLLLSTPVSCSPSVPEMDGQPALSIFLLACPVHLPSQHSRCYPSLHQQTRCPQASCSAVRQVLCWPSCPAWTPVIVTSSLQTGQCRRTQHSSEVPRTSTFSVTWFGWCVLKLPPASGAVWDVGKAWERRIGSLHLVNVLSLKYSVVHFIRCAIKTKMLCENLPDFPL